MRINYDNVIRQAGQIDSLGDDLKRIADELRLMMSEVPQAWSGEASKAYLNACEELKVKMTRSSQMVRAVARDIQTIATRIRDEDERMARLAMSIKNK